MDGSRSELAGSRHSAVAKPSAPQASGKRRRSATPIVHISTGFAVTEIIRGELAIGRGHRATHLYSVGPVRTWTMMQ